MLLNVLPEVLAKTLRKRPVLDAALGVSVGWVATVAHENVNESGGDIAAHAVGLAADIDAGGGMGKHGGRDSAAVMPHAVLHVAQVRGGVGLVVAVVAGVGVSGCTFCCR